MGINLKNIYIKNEVTKSCDKIYYQILKEKNENIKYIY